MIGSFLSSGVNPRRDRATGDDGRSGKGLPHRHLGKSFWVISPALPPSDTSSNMGVASVPAAGSYVSLKNNSIISVALALGGTTVAGMRHTTNIPDESYPGEMIRYKE